MARRWRFIHYLCLLMSTGIHLQSTWLCYAQAQCREQFQAVTTNPFICDKAECPPEGNVWGTVNYTKDSFICAAAWHDGRIIPWSDTMADRTVTWTPGVNLKNYHGTAQFGTNTSRYHNAQYYSSVYFTSPRKREILYDISTLLIDDGRIECHGRENADVDTHEMSFGLFINTNSGEAVPSGDPIKEGTGSTRNYITGFGNNYGAYYCTLKQTSNLYSHVTSIYTNNTADFIPVTLTKTASVGDNITLAFTRTQTGSTIRWKKDKDGGFYEDNVISEWDNLLTVTISNVELGHGGVYSVFDDSDPQRRGLMRLIVRVCPDGKYGVSCENVCGNCSNGGVCHDITGECICAPGYKGSHCKISCGNNRFGRTCTAHCLNGDSRSGCLNYPICTLDPYGCSCAIGFKRPFCTTEVAKLTSAPTVYYIGPTYVEVNWLKLDQIQPAEGPVKYLVEYKAQPSSDFRFFSIVDGSGTEDKLYGNITGLQADETVNIQVSIRLANGDTGKASPPLTVTTKCLKPRTPSLNNLLAVKNPTIVILSWRMSDWQCNSGRKTFTIEYQNSSNSDWIPINNISSSTRQLDLLSDACNSAWRVRIKAVNMHASSDYSDIKMITTLEEAPNVVNISVTATGNGLHASWSVPEYNGCSVTGYIVKYQLLDISGCNSSTQPVVTNFTVGNLTTTKTVTGLLFNSKYKVTVLAKTLAQEGNATETEQWTQGTVPSGVPTLVNADPHNDSADISWHPPECNLRNGVITKYEYNITNVNTACVTASLDKQITTDNNLTETVVTGLVPYNEYIIMIRAYTSAGPGPWCDSETFRTLEAILPEVSNLTAVEHNSSIRIQWGPPLDNGCQLLTYEWQFKVTSKGQCENMAEPVTEWFVVDKSVATASISQPYAFSTYNISVRGNGTSLVGLQRSFELITEESAPSGPPSDVRGDPTQKNDTTLRFSWEQPNCLFRNGDITKYKYEFRMNSTLNCITWQIKKNDTNEETVIFNNLLPYVNYEFRILAVVGDNLDGPWSNWTFQQTDQSSPPAPLYFNQTYQNSSGVVMNWKEPCPPHGIITEYKLEYWSLNDTDSSVMSANCSNCTELPVFGLTPDELYAFQVTAKTTDWGAPSHVVNVTISEAPPGSPASLEATKDQKSLTVSWTEPKVKNGDIGKYKISWMVHDTYDNKSVTGRISSEECNSTAKSFTIPDLTPSYHYEVNVSATTSAGYGPNITKYFWTKLADTVAIVNIPKIKKDEMTEKTVKLLLQRANYSGPISHYSVIVEKQEPFGRKKRQLSAINETTLTGYKNAKPIGGITTYITAKMLAATFKEEFTVGDKKTYDTNYYNGPLEKGAAYRFTFGYVVMSKDKTETKSFYQHIAVDRHSPDEFVEVRNYKAEAEAKAARENATTGGAVGGAVGALLVIIIVGLILYRRRHTSTKQKEDIPMSDITNKTQAENGASSPHQPAARPKDPHYAKPATKPKSIKPQPVVPKKNSEPSVEYVNAGKAVSVEEFPEYVKNKDEQNFEKEYKTLPSSLLFPHDVGSKPDNKTKNRYNNIVAYDKNRVILDFLEDDPHSDYINASYIDSYKKSKSFIAAQGPNRYTVDDFWRMIWQENVDKIVILTKPVEDGKRKCEHYWPDSLDLEGYGDISVTVIEEDLTPEYTIRRMEILKRSSKVPHEITQYHFTAWPDHGVPANPGSFWKFYRKIKSAMEMNGSAPTLVHCSAGVGRTGTFILLDILMEQSKKENKVDIFGHLYNLRQQRVNMIQTVDQYIFVHEAMVEVLQCGDTFIPTSEFDARFMVLCCVDPATKSSELHKQFKTLRSMCPALDPAECEAGTLAENVNKSRNPKILPIGQARPYLMTPGEDGGTDYINAVFVNGYRHKDAYIATQMPLPNTVVDFWRMVHDHDSHAIVMLNDSRDNDATCAQYWPNSGSARYGRYMVELINTATEQNEYLISRTMKLTDMKKKNDSFEIKHLEFKGWPKTQKIPSANTHSAFIELLDILERWQQQTKNKTITVHCLDGASRSGFFCAVDGLLEKIKVEQGVDVFQTVKNVRTNRPEFVPTLDQYRLLHQMALQFIHSFDIYANFK